MGFKPSLCKYTLFTGHRMTNDEILSRLKDLERQNDVKILYACESGCGARGFPSPDSDYDIRFIYAHPID